MAIDFVVFCITPAIALILRFDGLKEIPLYAKFLAIYTGLALLWKFVIFYTKSFSTRMRC